MNFGLYLLILILGLVGLAYGIMKKVKWLIIASSFAVVVFGLIVAATVLLVNGIK